MTKLHSFLCLALLLAISSNARAAGPSKKELRQLQTLSEIGQEACQSGDYSSCLRAFEQAQEILPWAPHEFYIAEALVGQGKLVEGSSFWSKILKENDPDSCHPSVCQAVRKARQRLNEVEPQIPKVSFKFAQDYGDVSVRWGGTPMTPAQLAAATPVNPGEYQVVVSAAGYRPLRATYALARGQQRVVQVELVSESPVQASAIETTSESPGWPAPLGITLAAAGGVALASGMATWSSKGSKLDAYKRDCQGRTPACQPSDAKAGEIENLTSLSNTLFVGGSVLLAAGTSVLVWHWSSGDSAEDPAQRTAFHVGPRSLSVSGTF